jgi:ribosomal protein S27AE
MSAGREMPCPQCGTGLLYWVWRGSRGYYEMDADGAPARRHFCVRGDVGAGRVPDFVPRIERVSAQFANRDANRKSTYQGMRAAPGTLAETLDV